MTKDQNNFTVQQNQLRYQKKTKILPSPISTNVIFLQMMLALTNVTWRQEISWNIPETYKQMLSDHTIKIMCPELHVRYIM